MNNKNEEIEKLRPRKSNGEFLTQIEYERMVIELKDTRKMELEVERLTEELNLYKGQEELIKELVSFKILIFKQNKETERTKEITRLLSNNLELEQELLTTKRKNEKMFIEFKEEKAFLNSEIEKLNTKNENLEYILAHKPETKRGIIKFNLEEVGKTLKKIQDSYKSTKDLNSEIADLKLEIKKLKELIENQKHNILIETDLKVKELEEYHETRIIEEKNHFNSEFKKVTSTLKNEIKQLENESLVLKDNLSKYKIIEEQFIQQRSILTQKNIIIEDLSEIKNSLIQQIVSKDDELKDLHKMIRKYQKTLEKSSLLNLKAESDEK